MVLLLVDIDKMIFNMPTGEQRVPKLGLLRLDVGSDNYLCYPEESVCVCVCVCVVVVVVVGASSENTVALAVRAGTGPGVGVVVVAGARAGCPYLTRARALNDHAFPPVAALSAYIFLSWLPTNTRPPATAGDPVGEHVHRCARARRWVWVWGWG